MVDYFTRSSFHLLSVSFFLLPSSDHPHRQTGSDWASGMPRISNCVPWEPTWCNLVQTRDYGDMIRNPDLIKFISKWAAPHHSQHVELDFTKHMFLLSGSSLADRVAASDAIPPLRAWRGRNRQPANVFSLIHFKWISLLAQSHPQGYNLSTVQSLLQTSLFLLKHQDR